MDAGRGRVVARVDRPEGGHWVFRTLESDPLVQVVPAQDKPAGMLREDYLKPLGLSANALAKALRLRDGARRCQGHRRGGGAAAYIRITRLPLPPYACRPIAAAHSDRHESSTPRPRGSITPVPRRILLRCGCCLAARTG